MLRRCVAVALCAAVVVAPSARSAEVDMARRADELKALKFGMFIHWSLATFTGSDIALGNTPISLFNPTGCDTDQWVSDAAGER